MLQIAINNDNFSYMFMIGQFIFNVDLNVYYNNNGKMWSFLDNSIMTEF